MLNVTFNVAFQKSEIIYISIEAPENGMCRYIWRVLYVLWVLVGTPPFPLPLLSLLLLLQVPLLQIPLTLTDHSCASLRCL